MYVLPLLSTVVNTETDGGTVKAVVRGTVEGSLPGVFLVTPSVFILDRFILVVHSERKRTQKGDRLPGGWDRLGTHGTW